MNVSILGFELKMSEGVSIGDFYQSLEKHENKEISIGSQKAVFYTDIIDNLICGVVINYKSNKKTLVSRFDKEGNFLFSKNKLKKHEHGSEVSIFIINPENLRGVFYSYSGALTATSFTDLLRKSHTEVVKYKKNHLDNSLLNLGRKEYPIYRVRFL